MAERKTQPDNTMQISCCTGKRAKISPKNDYEAESVYSRSSSYAYSIPSIQNIATHPSDNSSMLSKDYCDDLALDNPAFYDSEPYSHSGSTSTTATDVQDGTSVHFAEATLLQQRYSWDCGVTCVMMVLPPNERKYFLNNLKNIAEEENFNTSTWSIDLAYLLYRFGIPFRYYTITLGIDPGLGKESFYETAIRKDEMRVVERFGRAAELGMVVEKRSVPLSSILRHLKRRLPIIVLTNARLLHCNVCTFSSARARMRDCFAVACDIPYQGHFVLLVGCDPQSGLVYYANPTVGNTLCCCSYQRMEDARLCYGTDEDILFIDRNR
ncbi:Guanylyl cyclase [Trinorchestia longiramus]|nr:Guanylyl cyclase [Trinorchestia longiramus]